ncbi:single-stranded-DNA-specific exonuclease RecJ [Paenibacillus sp. y28]|uniref:single-stranded-DNA-specific exonuclease RecJ n=1 Tax=Paenibacillus sp. y28 TaxID=3129110 RepID=UPI003015BBF8
MLFSKARWDLPAADEKLAAQLAEQHKLEPLLAKLLAVRGITDDEQIQNLFSSGQGHFYDPFLLHGMKEAVERIQTALERGEKIRVYGDYDADGVSSTSLMLMLLEQLDAHYDYYIPHRVSEGYGLNTAALELAKQQGVSLIITVDTGISAVEQIAFAAQIGLDVIVTDHHEPPELLPDALAIINPKQPLCEYPFKQLAGVGVAFKLAEALLGRLPEELAEFAAIGTVADLMPLVDENRSIVKLGLRRMQETEYPGIEALFEVAGIDCGEANSTHVGFALAPRINAAGRLEHAREAVQLLTTPDRDEAGRLAISLDQLNKERQRIVEETTVEALKQLEGDQSHRVLVLAGEQWNVGVIGIVASKVLERYYRPTLIFSIHPETGMAKGSARSIAGFDMYKALTACSDLLDHFGGHQAAAGMTLHKDQLPQLQERLDLLAAEWMNEEDFMPVIQADAECLLSEVNVHSITQADGLAPYGMGNPSPRFVFTGLNISESRLLGKEKQHLKLVLAEEDQEGMGGIEALAFGRGSLSDVISPTARIDVLGELSINEWNGKRKPQILIQDLRVTEVQVFDWRGAANGPARVTAAVEHLRSLPQFGAYPLHIAAFGAERMQALASAGQHEAAAEVAAAAEQSSAYDFSQATDIAVFSLPSALAELEQMLASASRVQRIYVLCRAEDSANSRFPSALPGRDSFKAVYALLRQVEQWKQEDPRIIDGCAKRCKISPAAVRFIIDVFTELGFIQQEKLHSRVVSTGQAPKRDLAEALLYQQLELRLEAERTLIYTTGQELADWFKARLRRS